MKLLFYSHFFAPSVGGVETIVRSLAAGLAELKAPGGASEFELTLVTQTPPADFDDQSLNFRVVRQPPLSDLRRLIASSDVVHIAGPAILPLFFSLLARKPVVVEHHGFQTICPNGQLLIEPHGAPCPGHFMAGRHAECWRCNSAPGWLASRKLWLLTFVRRFLCQRTAANITPTRWLGELVQLPRITPIPHGLAPLAPRTSALPSSAPPVILFQGRLVTTKGVPLLLRAARILREQGRSFTLLIIGDGSELASLQQFVRESGLQEVVHFTGRLAAPELESAFARASLVVVPSLGGEVFGLVVAESMQRGLPVVASDLGAFTEVLGDSGMIFRTGDARHLAEVLDSVLNDAHRAADLGHRAALRAHQCFALTAMVQAHAALYRRIAR